MKASRADVVVRTSVRHDVTCQNHAILVSFWRTHVSSRCRHDRMKTPCDISDMIVTGGGPGGAEICTLRCI